MVVGRQQRNPSLSDALDKMLSSFQLDLHVALPGRVEAYDNAEQTVDVQPGIQQILTTDLGEPQAYDLPVLYDIPVIFPRAGDYFISFPLSAGDFVLILFNERPLDQWRDLADQAGTKTCAPGLREMHGLNGAVAIPGIYPTGMALTQSNASHMVLGSDTGNRIHLKSGVAEVVGATGVTGADDFVAQAGKVLSELQDIKTQLEGHQHTYIPPAPPYIGTPTGTTGSTAVYNPSSVASSNLKADD